MDAHMTESNWIQVNNTVVPVISRISSTGQLIQCVPLSVIRYGARLLHGVSLKTLRCTPRECHRLTRLCQKAGFEFEFPLNTEMILLRQLVRLYHDTARFTTLPGAYPFMYAQLVPEESSDDASSTASVYSSTDPADLSQHCTDDEADECTPLDLSNKAKLCDDTDLCIDLVVSAINRPNKGTMAQPQVSSWKTLLGKQIQCITNRNSEYVQVSDLYHLFFNHTSFTVFKTILNAVGIPLHEYPTNLQRFFSVPEDNKIKSLVQFDDAIVLLDQTKSIIRKDQHEFGRQTISRYNVNSGHCRLQTSEITNIQSSKKTSDDDDSSTDLGTMQVMSSSLETVRFQTKHSKESTKLPDSRKRKRLLDTVSRLYTNNKKS